MSDEIRGRVCEEDREVPEAPMNDDLPTTGGQPTTGENIPMKVMIIPVENGFIVEIGCKRFVSEHWGLVADGLEFYFKDPKAAEEKFCKK